jgi:hypothetical protein
VRLDRPTTGEVSDDFDRNFAIVSHPAFRIGFLDAQRGRRPDPGPIIGRIYTETPKGALRHLGWTGRGPLDEVALAQWRYEEGRALCIEHGLRCKAWGHPDFPPKQVMDYLRARAKRGAADRGPEA